MKKTITLNIKELPEGVFLATSKDIPGLVVQENTIARVVESSRDVAQQMIELQEKQRSKTRKLARSVTLGPPLTVQFQMIAV